LIPLRCHDATYLTNDFLGSRVDGGELLSADGVNELVVDEQLGELDLGLHDGDNLKSEQLDNLE
jgi:hypothetical protein